MADRTINCYLAGPRHVVQVLACVAPSLEEAGVAYPPIQEAHAIRWILDVMERGFVLAAVADGKMVGTLGFDAFRFPWNADLWCLNNTWFYLAPEYRRGGTAMMLLKHASRHADQLKAPLLMGNTSGLNAELKDVLIQRAGFTYVGGFFVRGLDRAEVDDEQPVRG